MRKLKEDKSKITYKDKVKEVEPRKVKTVKRDGKTFCKDFAQGEDGFCINYTGSKRYTSSCYYNCTL